MVQTKHEAPSQTLSSGRDSRAPGPSPGAAVRCEVLRALRDLALTPLRCVPYLARRGSLEKALRSDLEHPAAVDAGPTSLNLAGRKLSIFVSAAEHSGEVHAVNLVRALRREVDTGGGAPPRFHGLGSERLGAEEVEILGNPIARAAMGVDVLRSLPFYLRLFEDTARYLRDERPDLFLPVDSPALHVPLAHIAKRYGVPVAHYVTPQYWGWAPWRVGGYRRAVDLGLTILPFEPAWFERHATRTAHVGHPQVDELERRELHPSRTSGPKGERRALVLLPGSRKVVIRRNLPWMLNCAERVRKEHGGLEVLLANDDRLHADLLRTLVRDAGAEDWVRIDLGDLHRSLAQARAALSVSGTVLLDLLHHRIPTAVVYRLDRRISAALSRRFLTVPWFSSINLLAGHEVVPEACFAGSGPLIEYAEFLGRALTDDGFRARIQADLELAVARLGPAGAPRRAARHALALVSHRSQGTS